MSWRGLALCRDRPNRVWFDPALVDQAKAFCAACPVRQPCLEYAVAFDEPVGVWGGLTPSERSGRLTVSQRERLLVLAQIRSGVSTIAELQRRLGTTYPATRRHVRRLVGDGVVEATVEGARLRLAPARMVS